MSNDIEVHSALVSLAERKDLDPDKLEKLLDLHERHLKQQQESAFLEAMSNFQGDCPTIIRTKHVNFKSVDYWYAPLDEIVEAMRPHMSKYGLSFFFDTDIMDIFLVVKITICHKMGFQKTFTYKSDAIHDDDRMNKAQRRKSSLTYAKRAVLENAFGLVTAGEDDDARRVTDKTINESQESEIKKLLKNTKTKEADFFNHMSVSNIDELSYNEAKRGILLLKQKRNVTAKKGDLK